MRQPGRRLAYVVMPPVIWELAKDEYVTQTRRLGPLEVNGREVLRLPVEADPQANEVTVVVEDRDSH